MLERVREACARVAERATFVRPDGDLEAYVAGFDVAELHRPRYDTEHHYLGEPEARVAYVLVLDAVNFGSGYFPRLRTVDGRSGYRLVASALTRWFEAEGPPPPEALRGLDAPAVAALLGQDLDDPTRAELMELYGEALRELGAYVGERFGGHYDALVRACGHSAERLAALLAEMPLFRDVWPYEGWEVPLYKRAQIAASDLALAFGGRGYGAFHDLAHLTMFADDLVPHVLRSDGLLRYAPELAHRVDLGELLPPGSPAEVEIRAVAVDVVERMVALLRRRGVVVTARELDVALWNRGQQARYAGRPAHRTLTTAY